MTHEKRSPLIGAVRGRGTVARGAWSAAALFVVLSGGGSGSAHAQDAPPDLTGMSLDDLLETEVVYAASRRIQTLREAPSAVSVVTADEIRKHGYRTLADVLRSLPSFYVTEDRRYSYIGVRGFNQPGDYGARVLLLLNGLRTNDNLYEQAYVGEEFILDLDLVDRIEVVRGPSAAIYGNSAFFAVVNVVTRTGHDFQGGELSAEAASFSTFGGRATWGRRLDNGLDVLVSASLFDTGGQRLYFQEFDAPETAHGVADRIDGERSERAFVRLAKGDLSFEASHVSRDKGVPTAPFGTLFGDPRTRHTDAKVLVSLTWARALPGRSSLMARVNYGFSDYHGRFVLPSAADQPNDDSARGQWYGLEASAVRALGARHLVTAGVEFQDNFSQRQLNFDLEPLLVNLDARNSSERLAVFAQDEITLSERLTLHVGLRQDWNSNFGYETSPRLGLIYGAGEATTLKLLHGRAFRAPNEFELHYTNPVFKTNADLGPETIRTTEIVLQQTLPGGVHLNASTYFNAISGLISLAQDPADDLFFFQNASRSNAVGLEVALDLKRREGPSGGLSYAWQRSREHATGQLLTNSPRHSAKAQIAWPLLAERLTASADAFLLSSRRTLAGAPSGAAVVANVTLLAPRVGGRFELSGSVYNLFDRHYGDPGSVELLQDLVPQDGRNFRLKISWRF